MNNRMVSIAELAEKAQNQIVAARVVGKIAVQIGWRQTDRAIRNLIGFVTKPDSTPTIQKIEADPLLAIADYQQLAATDIIAQLNTLSSNELHAIADFENTHRKRRTVVNKISQLLSTEQIKKS